MRSRTALLSRVAPGLVLPARYWYRRIRRRADPEMAVIESLVRPGSVALDIGGNFGDYTFALARRARAVVTFEPLPECVRVIRAARLKNVVVRPVALSSTSGSVSLYVPLGTDGEEDPGQASLLRPERDYRVLEVPVKRLDDLQINDVSVVKIDVEGHEMAVLQGAEETLRRELPIVLVEIEERHLGHPVGRVFRVMEALGFTGYFLDGKGVFRGVEEFSEAVHQRPYVECDSDPAYINDFFFVARGDPRHVRFRSREG
jgi:FkbM family methyltransferase